MRTTQATFGGTWRGRSIAGAIVLTAIAAAASPGALAQLRTDGPVITLHDGAADDPRTDMGANGVAWTIFGATLPQHYAGLHTRQVFPDSSLGPLHATVGGGPYTNDPCYSPVGMSSFAVSTNDAGGTKISWNQIRPDAGCGPTGIYSVEACDLTPSGACAAPPVRIVDNLATGGIEVALNDTGDYVVVWYEGSPSNRIRAVGVTAAGVMSPIVTVSPGVNMGISGVAIDGSGNFSVATMDSSDQKCHLRRFAIDGTPIGSDLPVSPGMVSSACGLAGAPDGRLVMVYRLQATQALVARLIDAAGVPAPGEIAVSPINSGESFPAVAMDRDGRFLVAWRGAQPLFHVFARGFDASGVAQGPELNVSGERSEYSPHVGTDNGGRGVVTWRPYINFTYTPRARRLAGLCPTSLFYKDADGDGFGTSEQVATCGAAPGAPYTATVSGDCDDADFYTHPGADEIHDGLDNQCPGEPGHGSVDEISGTIGFFDAGDRTRLSWPAQSLATAYEVLRMTGPAGGSCTSGATNDAFWVDATEPAEGAGFFYLVRSLSPSVGSWGADSSGAERAPSCAP